MSTRHLLPLSVLHAAAPGVLDVILSTDGDFEGAPGWCPPLWVGTWDGERCRWGWRWDVVCDDGHLIVPDEDDLIEDAAFDCRVPSVAARLAGLCARALGETNVRAAWLTSRGRVLLHTQEGVVAGWDDWTGRRIAQYGGEAPDLPRPDGSTPVEYWLASLALVLAPKIAALGGPRG